MRNELRVGKLKFFFLSLLIAHCSLLIVPLFAFGQQDEPEQPSLNNEWRLCVTAFDYTMLPQSQRIAGNVINRSLVDKLKTVSYRLRLSPEYAYYEGYAWQQSVNTAAKAISQKREERSQMLYRGDADWRYRRNIQKVDADIEKLIEALAEKEAQKPLVNTEPAFSLNQANLNGNYPQPPLTGAERRFCRTQNSDAFLTGEVREFHGRYYIRVRLFILYTNSFVYEDDIIFSMEDSEAAVEEIANRLITVLSGNRPAFLAVQADPPESQILINQGYAGRGRVQAQERPPGTVFVAVAADGYTPELVEAELKAGELTEVSLSLGPLLYADVNVLVPGGEASVYQGALYVGEAPLTLRLPIDQLEYVNVETGLNETGRAVFTSPDMPDETINISLGTKIPPPSGQKRVNTARNRYYWAWGATWTAGILAWVTTGIYNSQNDVLLFSRDENFHSSTQRMYYISGAALVLLGVAIVHDVYRMVRYMSAANEGATPIVRQEKQK